MNARGEIAPGQEPDRCACCRQIIEQRRGGRRREYCSDACRQRAHRSRSRQQEIATYAISCHFLPDSARKFATLIQAEKRAVKIERMELQARIALLESRLNTATRDLAQLREQLAKTEAARAMQAEIVMRRGAQLRQQAKRIADLERELEAARRSTEHTMGKQLAAIPEP